LEERVWPEGAALDFSVDFGTQTFMPNLDETLRVRAVFTDQFIAKVKHFHLVTLKRPVWRSR
jgi:hypothetical protein